MAQPNTVGGGGSGSAAAGGRRVPLSLSGAGAGSSLARLQQAAAAGSNGRSKSPQNKKNETNIANSGPFVVVKKSSSNQHRISSASSSSSSSSKDDDKKTQNGVSKSSSHGNSKAAQNGSSSIPVAVVVKEQQKSKEKQSAEKKEASLEAAAAANDEAKPAKKETEITQPTAGDNKTEAVADADAIAAAVSDNELKNESAVVVPATSSTTPTAERKSSRRSATQQKSPGKPQPSKESSVQTKQETETLQAAAVEDVEMEPLTVDASPIRSVASSAQPTATSTPGRNLFGFQSSVSKQANEVELTSQQSISPAVAVARNFSQISGRRSIRPAAIQTPGRMGNYRCLNTSELDTSGFTNTSMNATVGSEIPNSSSFSFSFFGRGRKRERTPPPLSGSQSANDLAQDVEMSPPKRARFELFSMSLASPFSMLRSRFSKATISTPSSRKQLDQTPPTGDDEEDGGVGKVQNVSGIIIQEEEDQLNRSASNNSEDVTVAKEAGLETPKKCGTTPKEQNGEQNKKKVGDEEQAEDAVANLPATDGELPAEANRSRCAIM
ncbi:GH14452 [Drosophila grimshawi]|uniref:GH14452 n=2 Tax=Drosophila grimshawi TaxID=7222 RepID=B4JV38_DROGR|nr:GH14452 [Drosophila grimshawi]